MDGIVAWKREKEKEKLAHRELSKLQAMDSRHQLKQVELAAFDDNESLMKEAKAQAHEMFESMIGRQPQGQPLAVTLQGTGIKKRKSASRCVPSLWVWHWLDEMQVS